MPATRQTAAATSIGVQYMGNRAVTVRGAVSGRSYTFRTPGELQRVDARDRPGLLRTRLFRTT